MSEDLDNVIDEDSLIELERVETDDGMTVVLEDIASELVSLLGIIVGTDEKDVVEVIIELGLDDDLVPGLPFQLSVPVNVDVGSTDIEDFDNADEVTLGISDVEERDFVEVIIELDDDDVLVPGRPFHLSVPVNVVVVAIDKEAELGNFENFDGLNLEASDVKVVETELKLDVSEIPEPGRPLRPSEAEIEEISEDEEIVENVGRLLPIVEEVILESDSAASVVFDRDGIEVV